jgi:hypothetical protein
VSSAKATENPAPRKWRVITTQREVVVTTGSRAHALWAVATDKRHGERIVRVVPEPEAAA